MLQIKGNIINGQLLVDKKLIVDYCKKQKDCSITLSITTDKPTRSKNQNKYYWGVVVKMLSEELGYYADEIHELLKLKFWGSKTIIDFEGNETIIANSSQTDTQDYEQKLEQIRIWALTEFFIVIPKPNE